MSMLKVPEVARRLGISEQGVRLWCRTGLLPAYRPAGTRQWLIDPEEFETWLRQPKIVDTLEWLHNPNRYEGSEDELVEELARLRNEAGPGSEPQRRPA